jgi:cystathionine beta-lyase/cystathionine gamma-synthase
VFFGRHIPCLSIIFQSGIFKHRILILTSQKRSKVSSHQYKDSFAESPTNPAGRYYRFGIAREIAKKHNLILIIDNCFATPYLQQPMKWGAHLVVTFCYKLMDGQDVLGG